MVREEGKGRGEREPSRHESHVYQIVVIVIVRQDHVLGIQGQAGDPLLGEEAEAAARIHVLGHCSIPVRTRHQVQVLPIL